MSADDIDLSLKEVTDIASGCVDGVRLLKALGLDLHHVTHLVITVNSSQLIECQVTRYLTRGEIAALAKELPQLELKPQPLEDHNE